MRLLMLFALATLAVIGVIAVLFIGNFRQSQRDSIVLPDAAQSAQPAAQQPGEEPSLLEVSRSNVQSIVRYLHRPQYYHQSYTITRQMGGAASESTAELWVSDTRVCAVLTSAAGEKHLLTDGQTLYVWYASDEKVRQLPVAADVTMDELTGITPMSCSIPSRPRPSPTASSSPTTAMTPAARSLPRPSRTASAASAGSASTTAF